jgi:hypothetical protein
MCCHVLLLPWCVLCVQAAMQRLFGLDLPISVAQVKENTNYVELLETHPWLNQVCNIVVCVFGRGGGEGLRCVYEHGGGGGGVVVFVKKSGKF